MNDRYLFKAKHMNAISCNSHLNGIWVKGFLCSENYINTGEAEVLIDPVTICQCTGLKDKNGTLIWENDLVLTPKEDGYSLICWNDTEARWEMYNEAEKIVLDFDNYWANEIEVVGNRLAIQYIMEESEEKKNGI